MKYYIVSIFKETTEMAFFKNKDILVPNSYQHNFISFFREGEPQILDYATQQHKLFICIATAHALQLSSNWLWRSFSAVLADMKHGNTDSLPEVSIFLRITIILY